MHRKRASTGKPLSRQGNPTEQGPALKKLKLKKSESDSERAAEATMSLGAVSSDNEVASEDESESEPEPEVMDILQDTFQGIAQAWRRRYQRLLQKHERLKEKREKERAEGRDVKRECSALRMSLLQANTKLEDVRIAAAALTRAAS
jgi:hypothetical protein